MRTILFLMFFVSPPAEKGKEVWSLQNTDILEFSSKEICKKAGEKIQEDLSMVDTLRVRGWCLDESELADPKTMELLPPRPKYDLSIEQLKPSR